MLGSSFSFDWEVKLIQMAQAHFNGFEIFLSRLLSILGQEYALVLIVLILFFCVDRKVGRRICTNLLTVLIWAPMVKNVFFRRRPYFDHEGIDILLPVDPFADKYDIAAQGFSLPSAHSACSAAAYPSLARYFKKKIYMVFAIILVFLIGASRFCVGAHYPTDVIVGWGFGIVISLIVPWLSEKLKSENLASLILLATGIPGFFFCQTEDFYSGFALMLGASFGFMVEEKYVGFERPKTFLQGLIRIALALAVFLGLAQGIKLILGTSKVVRVIRYSIGSFVTVGIYPMLFKYIEKEK